MAKDTVKTTLEEKTPLPYSATVENIEKVIDTIKRKPGDEKNIKTICSFSDFGCTKNALETLGIVVGYELAPLGKKIAYATESKEKNKFYLDAIMAYPPYELLLMHLRTKPKGFEAPTNSDIIRGFWGGNSIGSTEDNRERAVPALGSFISLAGLGRLIVGRGKNPTRIEWSTNALSLIEDYSPPINEQDSNPAEPTSTTSLPCNETGQPEDAPTATPQPIIKLNNTQSQMTPHITIEVNMSDWDTKKIKAFFKYAYGDFSDDRKEED